MQKKSLRAVFLLVLFLCSFPALSQSGESADAEGQASSLSQATSEIQTADLYDSSSAALAPSSPSTFGLVVRMVVVLAVVLACVYGFVRLMRRGIGGGADTDDPFLRKVSQVSLAPGKSVQIVTVLDHAYIVGVSDNAVSLIGEIADKEIVDSMNLFSDQANSTKKPMNFGDVLDLFLNKKPGARMSFSDVSRTAADNLKQQRENFNSRGN